MISNLGGLGCAATSRVFAFVSSGADKKATSGRGAPQLGDLRLLQDRGERGGALDSDVVPVETVRARGGAGMANE